MRWARCGGSCRAANCGSCSPVLANVFAHQVIDTWFENTVRLNEEKIRLVRFSKRAQRRGNRQEGFDFLGFTFYPGRSRRGAIIPKLKTSGKRLRSKLNRVGEWARRVRNVLPLKQIRRVFGAKLRGHIQYYGVSFNGKAVNEFVYQATRIL